MLSNKRVFGYAINEMLSDEYKDEKVPYIFNSETMNRNWYSMVLLMSDIFSEAILHQSDDVVFKGYQDFAKKFNFEFHVNLLEDLLEKWNNGKKDNPDEFISILELFAKSIYTMNVGIEEHNKMIKKEEYNAIFNIYLDILPDIMAVSGFMS